MLEFILLGLLHTPRSGYELKAVFREGAAFFWDADLSQIYRTLQRMEAHGWLRSTRQASEAGPDRRVYARTEAGEAALDAWLRQDPIDPVVRLPYVAQLFFLGEAGDLDRTRAFLETLRGRFERRVAALEAIDSDFRGTDDRQFCVLLTLRLGLATARARLAWCRDALRRVAQRRAAARKVTI